MLVKLNMAYLLHAMHPDISLPHRFPCNAVQTCILNIHLLSIHESLRFRGGGDRDLELL